VHRGGSHKQSADGSVANMARESVGRRRFQQRIMDQGESRGVRADSALEARMRRCLILRQGGEPPETPGPFSLLSEYPEGRESVKGSQAAQKARALDRFPSFRRNTSWLSGKGGPRTAALSCLPLVGPRLLRKGGTIQQRFLLTQAGLLMEAATVRSGGPL
jgi:hypothetical protein